jgi:hypothetical protein
MLKTIIWIVTVLGLLPVTLFAIAYLVFTVLSARLPKEPIPPGAVSEIGDVSMQIGSSSNKLHMSTKPWPAVVVVAGVFAVIVGLLFLLPRQPDRVRSGGFSKMESYIVRLLRSRKKFASFIVATQDGQHALLVMRQNGRTVLSVSADRTKNDGEEVKVRDFFTKLGMKPSREYRSANGGVENAICSFEFELADDPKAIARLCVAVFTDLFGVTDQQGLEFTTDGL